MRLDAFKAFGVCDLKRLGRLSAPGRCLRRSRRLGFEAFEAFDASGARGVRGIGALEACEAAADPIYRYTLLMCIFQTCQCP